MIEKLFHIIEDRRIQPIEGSYTNKLFDSGYEQISKKVGEEAIEVIIAAGIQGKNRIVEETSDLIYHLFVLLVYEGISLDEIETELTRRHFAKNK